MKFNNVVFVFCAAGMIIAQGCAPEIKYAGDEPTPTNMLSTSNASTDPNATVNNSLPNGSTVASTVKLQDLAGKWKGPCYPDSGSSSSFQTVFDFTAGGQFIQNDVEYSGTSCTGTPNFTTQTSGTITLGNMNQRVATATNLTFTTTAVSGTPNSSLYISDLNSNNYCDINTWTVGATKNIPLTASCLEGMSATQQTFFTLASGALSFANDDGTGVDTAHSFSRQ